MSDKKIQNWQFDIINAKGVDQYNKSLNNLRQVLRLDDLVRNKANEKENEKVPYFVIQSEVFEITKLPLTIDPTDNSICYYPRLKNLKKWRSESFNEPKAIIMCVSLSGYSERVRISRSRENLEWLLPFSPKKVYDNVLHQQLQLWSDICYLWKNGKNDIDLNENSFDTNGLDYLFSNKNEHNAQSSTGLKIYLVFTNKRKFAQKLQNTPLDTCFGHKNTDWKNVIQCRRAFSSAETEFLSSIRSNEAVVERDIKKRIGKLGMKNITDEKLDTMTLSALRRKWFDLIYLSQFVETFENTSDFDWDTQKEHYLDIREIDRKKLCNLGGRLFFNRYEHSRDDFDDSGEEKGDRKNNDKEVRLYDNKYQRSLEFIKEMFILNSHGLIDHRHKTGRNKRMFVADLLENESDHASHVFWDIRNDIISQSMKRQEHTQIGMSGYFVD